MYRQIASSFAAGFIMPEEEERITVQGDDSFGVYIF